MKYTFFFTIGMVAELLAGETATGFYEKHQCARVQVEIDPEKYHVTMTMDAVAVRAK